MLYLPPHYAHEGTALDTSITISIGFRSPTHQMLMAGLLEAKADSLKITGRYRDAGIKPTQHPAALPEHLLLHTKKLTQQIRFTKQDIRDFLGLWLTEPKPQVYYPERIETIDSSILSQSKVLVTLDRRTKALYYGAHFYINGEPSAISATLRLKKLADQRFLNVKWKDFTDFEREYILEWQAAGWINIKIS